jgi:hypothetical protein
VISLFESSDCLLPKRLSDCKIFECEFSDISSIFKRYHYKGTHMGGGISYCLKLCYRDGIIGGAVVGKPRHLSKYRNSLEIRRLACLEVAPKNTESYFLSKIIWFLKNREKDIEYVISYSDLSVGHIGTIYKASNFKCIGETSCSKHVYWKGVRYHPRSLTIDRPYSYKLREAVKTGEAKVVDELPKKIWVYDMKGSIDK